MTSTREGNIILLKLIMALYKFDKAFEHVFELVVSFDFLVHDLF